MLKASAAIMLMIFAFSPCANELTAAEIVKKTTAVMQQTKNYRVSMEATLTNDGGFPDGIRSATSRSTGVIDISNTAFQIDTQESSSLGAQTTSRQQYIVDNLSYSYREGRWYSHPASQHDWKSISSLDLKRLSTLLDGAQGEFAGYEDVEGTSCYVIEVTPDVKNLFNVAMNHPGVESQDAETIQFWDSMEKTGSMKLWVAIDSYKPIKSEFIFRASIPSHLLGQQGGSPEVKLTQTVTVLYLDYNGVGPIVVPPDALTSPPGP